MPPFSTQHTWVVRRSPILAAPLTGLFCIARIARRLPHARRAAPEPTACAAGGSGAMAMYVNGAWSCAGGGGGGSYTFRNNLTNTSGTVDFTPLDSSVMNAVDDFLPSTDTSGSIGQLGWGPTSIGSGCSAVSNNGVTNHPGIFNLRAGNAANSGCTLTLSDAYSGNNILPIANLGVGGAWSYWETRRLS